MFVAKAQGGHRGSTPNAKSSQSAKQIQADRDLGYTIAMTTAGRSKPSWTAEMNDESSLEHARQKIMGLRSFLDHWISLSEEEAQVQTLAAFTWLNAALMMKHPRAYELAWQIFQSILSRHLFNAVEPQTRVKLAFMMLIQSCTFAPAEWTSRGGVAHEMLVSSGGTIADPYIELVLRSASSAGFEELQRVLPASATAGCPDAMRLELIIRALVADLNFPEVVTWFFRAQEKKWVLDWSVATALADAAVKADPDTGARLLSLSVDLAHSLGAQENHVPTKEYRDMLVGRLSAITELFIPFTKSGGVPPFWIFRRKIHVSAPMIPVNARWLVSAIRAIEVPTRAMAYFHLLVSDWGPEATATSIASPEASSSRASVLASGFVALLTRIQEAGDVRMPVSVLSDYVDQARAAGLPVGISVLDCCLRQMARQANTAAVEAALSVVAMNPLKQTDVALDPRRSRAPVVGASVHEDFFHDDQDFVDARFFMDPALLSTSQIRFGESPSVSSASGTGILDSGADSYPAGGFAGIHHGGAPLDLPLPPTSLPSNLPTTSIQVEQPLRLLPGLAAYSLMSKLVEGSLAAGADQCQILFKKCAQSIANVESPLAMSALVRKLVDEIVATSRGIEFTTMALHGLVRELKSICRAGSRLKAQLRKTSSENSLQTEHSEVRHASTDRSLFTGVPDERTLQILKNADASDRALVAAPRFILDALLSYYTRFPPERPLKGPWIQFLDWLWMLGSARGRVWKDDDVCMFLFAIRKFWLIEAGGPLLKQMNDTLLAWRGPGQSASSQATDAQGVETKQAAEYESAGANLGSPDMWPGELTPEKLPLAVVGGRYYLDICLDQGRLVDALSLTLALLDREKQENKATSSVGVFFVMRLFDHVAKERTAIQLGIELACHPLRPRISECFGVIDPVKYTNIILNLLVRGKVGTETCASVLQSIFAEIEENRIAADGYTLSSILMLTVKLEKASAAEALLLGQDKNLEVFNSIPRVVHHYGIVAKAYAFEANAPEVERVTDLAVQAGLIKDASVQPFPTFKAVAHLNARQYESAGKVIRQHKIVGRNPALLLGVIRRCMLDDDVSPDDLRRWIGVDVVDEAMEIR
jgi:hypothetical protein